jgi:hypothetical protein
MGYQRRLAVFEILERSAMKRVPEVCIRLRTPAVCAREVRSLLCVLALMSASPCLAGPPLITDDPEPAPLHHWEIAVPFFLETAHGEAGEEMPTIDANYGAGKHLQLSVESGVLRLRPPGAGWRGGWRDTELGVKYRFIYAGRENHRMQVAFYPEISFPTGNARHGLGSGCVDYELPFVWLYELGEKARIYGDLRANFVHAVGSRNFFFTGLAFEADLAHMWTLTGEIYGLTAAEQGGSGTLGFNIGCIYELQGGSAHDPERGMSLLFSMGRAFSSRGPDLTFYFGPRFTYR